MHTLMFIASSRAAWTFVHIEPWKWTIWYMSIKPHTAVSINPTLYCRLKTTCEVLVIIPSAHFPTQCNEQMCILILQANIRSNHSCTIRNKYEKHSLLMNRDFLFDKTPSLQLPKVCIVWNFFGQDLLKALSYILFW